MENRLSGHGGDMEPQRNRLPTLMEVLSRRTLAPVDLFSFYIYMRDQQQSVDYLDFWLDVSQHLSLCRHYVRELRRSVLVETPDIETKQESHHPLDSFDLGESGRAASLNSEKSRTQRLSQYLRNSGGSRHSDSQHRASPDHEEQKQQQSQEHTHWARRRGSDSSRNGNDDSSTPEHTVHREDIRASAEKILYTFLLAGSEREIILPQRILHDITIAIEEHGRDDPEVFDSAKDYVFQAMERDAYPGFLRAKALGNLVPASLLLRLVVGLLTMFGAFWTGFILIFLDYGRKTRCWLILPFLLGTYALASHQYSLDPVLAFIGSSETTFIHFTKVREPFVRRLLTKRGMVVMWWIVFISAALVCLFVFVPGKRL